MKRNILYNMMKSCSAIIFPLITFPYISRVLMPANLGKYNFSSAYVSYFALLASLGVTTYAIRECAAAREDEKKLRDVASQIFSINICTTIIAYALLAFSLLAFRTLAEYQPVIVVLSLAVVFTAAGADWLNSAMEDFKFITIRTFLFQILSFILMILAVRDSDDYMAYALITVLSGSGANLVNIWYRRRYCRVRFTFKIDWKRHLPPIILLFAMQLSQIIFSSCDITMLGLMKGNYEVGLYSTAVKIYNMANQVIASVLWVVMPRLSILFAEKNYGAINILLRKVLGYTFFLGLPCITGIWMLAEEIIMMAGGIHYLDAAPVLRILMIALFFSLIGGGFIGNIIMLPSKRERIYLFACCITAIVNVITNAIMIPRFGIYGAAVTTALSAFLIWVILRARTGEQIRIGKIGPLVKAPALECIAIIIIVPACRRLLDELLLRSCAAVIASGAAYVAIVAALKYELTEGIMDSLVRKLKK